MTAEEIRTVAVGADDPLVKIACEIAAQLAEANAFQRERAEKLDAQLADSDARADKKSEFLDQLTEQFKPILPKLQGWFESIFPTERPEWPTDVPPAPVAIIAPPNHGENDAQMLDYLRSRGHDTDKANQILSNHRPAVLQEMFQAGLLGPFAGSTVATPASEEPQNNGEERKEEGQAQ